MLAKTCDLLPLWLVVVTRREEEQTWSGSVEDTLVPHLEVGGMTDGSLEHQEQPKLVIGNLGTPQIPWYDPTTCQLWQANDRRKVFEKG